MRVIRVDIPVKRSRGRHRRQQRRKHRQPLLALAIAAVVTLGLVAGSSAGGPTTGASNKDADVVPAGSSGHVSGHEGLERFLDPAHLSAVPAGPGDVAEPVQAVLSGARVIEALGESGIPVVALRAYQEAASALATDDESCGLRWTLLAAIGRVESNHGRFGGAQLREDGTGTKPIRGIPLDGRPNVALIRDTDGGALDGDATYDRAVGPMQFIPSTWRSVAADANADGRRDPNNIYDAAAGAAVYLCAGDTDLRDQMRAARAIRRYNNADEYVRVVLSLAELYETRRVGVVSSSPVPRPEDSTPESTAATPATPRRPTSSAPAAPPAPVGKAPAPAPTEATAAEPSANPWPEETVPIQPPQLEEPVPAQPQPGKVVSGGPTPPEEAMSVEPTPHVEQPPTAAVGWAPAMREVVLTVVEEPPVLPGPTPVPVPGPGS